MAALQQGLTLFFSLLVEAIPFLLLGVLFSSILLLWVEPEQLLKLLPRHPLGGAIAGAVLGCLLPVCECGNVPVARRLLTQGMPSAVAVGFLLGAPTINPIVIWSTWVAFRDQPVMVWGRVVLTLFVAVVVGWVFSVQQDLRPFLQPAVAQALPVGQPLREPVLAAVPTGNFFALAGGKTLPLETTGWNASRLLSRRGRWQMVWVNALTELRELGGVLILGTAVAAAIQVLTPREVILGLGQGPVTSVVAMLVLGTVVSICSTVDAFFALSFAGSFTAGALLAFLVFGPMVDLKGVSLLLTVFRPRAVLYLFLLAGLLTFVLTLAMNLYL
ncbi:permease [Gloeomargarita lithophora Alchichica-D10]|uniref:Permease n=1 Tax=Gloeomargarita lithophora Alchichica-D10 TaxID=1188229 RepID=A0A1J0ABX3_9CYAN|nr:permease [Gloeomargarita lithophora]APB33427.1 permease [Gloeomargarita lithophora Alchichica-D10]